MNTYTLSTDTTPAREGFLDLVFTREGDGKVFSARVSTNPRVRHRFISVRSADGERDRIVFRPHESNARTYESHPAS